MAKQNRKTDINRIPCKNVACIIGEHGCLGQGSFGVVRAGFYENCITIAAKCSEYTGSTRQQNILEKKIRDELYYLQRAEHQNIVKVFGFSRWKNSVAIIMEYLPGGNLAEFLDDTAVDITPLIALQFCTEIANGLAHIHTISPHVKLVHGDIKSENILLDANLHCKIADFGGARIKLHTASKSRTQNLDKKRQFTELYAAPELLENISTPMKSTHDVFSYSIVVYEILERHKPIAHVQQLDMYTRQVIRGTRPIIDVTERKQELEAAGLQDEAKILDVLVHTMEDCWNQNPASRPSMTNVQSDLTNFAEKIDISRLDEDMTAAKNDCEMIVFDKDDQNQEILPIDKFSPPFFDDDLGESSKNQEMKNGTRIQPGTSLLGSNESADRLNLDKDGFQEFDPAVELAALHSQGNPEPGNVDPGPPAGTPPTSPNIAPAPPLDLNKAKPLNSPPPDTSSPLFHPVPKCKPKAVPNKDAKIPAQPKAPPPNVARDEEIARELARKLATENIQKNFDSKSNQTEADTMPKALPEPEQPQLIVPAAQPPPHKSTVVGSESGLDITTIAKESILVFNYEEIFVFDVGTQEFFHVPPLNEECHGASFAIHKDKCYVIGGGQSVRVGEQTYGNDKRVKVLQLNPLAAYWTKVEPTLRERNGARSCSCGNYVYTIGESTNKSLPRSSGERYDPIKHKWTAISNMQHERKDFDLVCVDGKPYAIGGTELNSVEVFHPALNTWSVIASMTSKRTGVAAVVLFQKIYAIGGWNKQEGVLSSVERYDEYTNQWETVASLNEARCHHTAAVVNGKIYVAGGFRCTDCDGPIDVVEVYVPDTDTGAWINIGTSEQLKGRLSFVSL